MTEPFDYLSPTTVDEDEMGRLLDLIEAEWRSDPSSVACFDLRIVEDVSKALASWRKRKEATDRERRRFEMRRGRSDVAGQTVRD